MVNKDNQPNGWGRAIEHPCNNLYEGQFKDGAVHGYVRIIYYGGIVHNTEFKNETKVK